MPRRYTRVVTAKKRTTRAVYGAYVVLMTAFVVSSIAQVARVVFDPTSSDVPRPGTAYPTVGGACRSGLEEQTASIETARLAASTEPTAEHAKARYETERRAARGRIADLEQSCATDPHRTDALAALASLDRAAEAHAIRDADELSPVRLTAQSFISGHKR